MAIRPVLVQPRHLADIWPEASPLVALACARSSGKFEAPDIVRAVTRGEFQLWLGVTEREAHPVQVILITRVLNYPRLRACELLACVGDDRESWEDLLDEIERWARDRGCALMQPIARPGWERVLAKRGYRKTHVMLEKPL
jgi:hypothetical protein